MRSSHCLFLRRFLLLAATVLGTGTVAYAGVTVTGGTAPGATSWSGTPIVATVNNPSGDTSVAEGFSAPATSYGQTFTIPITSSYVLTRVCLYVGGGTGTSTSAPLMVNLYDLRGQAAPNPSSYSGSANLLGGGNGLPLTYTTQANGILQLDFTGADQVTLLAGRMYVLEISGVSGTNPLGWLRGITDTYAGGAAYRSGSWINGSNARDFALAVYGTPTATPATSTTIDGSVTHQVIDGFGAGTAFLDAGIQQLTNAQMDALYGTGTNQMGLTLIRVRISPNGSSDWGDAIANGQKAVQRGAKILATPWTPPPAMKTTNNIVHGSLLPAQYQNYVDYLNSFLAAMATAGAPVSVVSLQNEPDYDPTYEGCQWTAAQFDTFCRDFAGGLKAPVMMPESYSFAQALSDQTLQDPAAAANVTYVGGHLYGGGLKDYPLAHSLGKHTWMTEYLINDQTIGSAVSTAQQISDCLTVGNMSAYIWWKTIGDANGLLNASGTLQPRAFVMGQFSRFVRPGDVRIDVPANSSSLGVSAFVNQTAGTFAIVAVNTTGAAVDNTFQLHGLTPGTVTPWVTSATASLAAQPPIAVTNGAFTYTVPATSVVTFVGATTAVPQIVTAPESHTMATGSTAVLDVEATGGPLTYQWLHNGTAISGATGSRLVVPHAQTADAGAYAVRVTNAIGSVTSSAATLTVIATTNPGHLLNLSLRSYVSAGDSVAIGGFVINGTGAKRMLIRASGPALGFAGTLTDPTLSLYDDKGNVVQTDDDWDASLAPAFSGVGAFPWPTGSKDAAMVVTLQPGAHTAIAAGKAADTGVALVEIYDADPATPGASLINLSGRSLVGSGDNVQIAGLVIGGSTDLTVIFRAAGPALTALTGMQGTLPDPVIELHRQSDNAIIATSDDWDTSLGPYFESVGAFAWQVGSKDAAMMMTLPPDGYTVLVKDKNGASGIALVEVYAVP
ncbi:MAG TPA: immunoglobulin domain-containing protein [Opitutaceae bacterium]|nr:immunoglobulin domain-containing protein [Opitutaceae bacterium]